MNFMTTINKNIYTNFKNIEFLNKSYHGFNIRYIGEKKDFISLIRLAIKLNNSDTIILNMNHQMLVKLCFLKYLLPLKRFRLISVDLILRKPFSIKLKLKSYISSILFKKLDMIILYFKQTDGYEQYYNIPQNKIKYVPFKVNSWKSHFMKYSNDPLNGEYILCAGRTYRDLSTFVEAAQITKMPSVLLTPGKKMMQQHGTHLVIEKIPKNLQIIYDKDFKEETFLQWIKSAAIVVLPRFSYDISATGISTYLCAMAAWRCVIISKGPGADDILTNDQAIFVDPENSIQLANAIYSAWHDTSLRKKVAINGRKYAEKLQGEERLLNDIFDLV